MEKIAVAPVPHAEYTKYLERFMRFVTNTNLSQESIEGVDLAFVRYYKERLAKGKPHSTVERTLAAWMDSLPARSKQRTYTPPRGPNARRNLLEHVPPPRRDLFDYTICYGLAKCKMAITLAIITENFATILSAAYLRQDVFDLSVAARGLPNDSVL